MNFRFCHYVGQYYTVIIERLQLRGTPHPEAA